MEGLSLTIICVYTLSLRQWCMHLLRGVTVYCTARDCFFRPNLFYLVRAYKTELVRTQFQSVKLHELLTYRKTNFNRSWHYKAKCWKRSFSFPLFTCFHKSVVLSGTTLTTTKNSETRAERQSSPLPTHTNFSFILGNNGIPISTSQSLKTYV